VLRARDLNRYQNCYQRPAIRWLGRSALKRGTLMRLTLTPTITSTPRAKTAASAKRGDPRWPA
jgi:hypothetical protein